MTKLTKAAQSSANLDRQLARAAVDGIFSVAGDDAFPVFNDLHRIKKAAQQAIKDSDDPMVEYEKVARLANKLPARSKEGRADVLDALKDLRHAAEARLALLQVAPSTADFEKH
jgi:hypothetical protein